MPPAAPSPPGRAYGKAGLASSFTQGRGIKNIIPAPAISFANLTGFRPSRLAVGLGLGQAPPPAALSTPARLSAMLINARSQVNPPNLARRTIPASVAQIRSQLVIGARKVRALVGAQ